MTCEICKCQRRRPWAAGPGRAHQNHRHRRCGGCRRDRRARASCEAGPGCGARGRRVLAGHTRTTGTAGVEGAGGSCRRAGGRWPAREPSAPRASLGASSRSLPVPSGPSGTLHTGGTCGSGVPGQAPPRSLPVPSGPSGTLHTGGACRSGVPGQAPPPTGTAADTYKFRTSFPCDSFKS